MACKWSFHRNCLEVWWLEKVPCICPVDRCLMKMTSDFSTSLPELEKVEKLSDLEIMVQWRHMTTMRGAPQLNDLLQDIQPPVPLRSYLVEYLCARRDDHLHNVGRFNPMKDHTSKTMSGALNTYRFCNKDLERETKAFVRSIFKLESQSRSLVRHILVHRQSFVEAFAEVKVKVRGGPRWMSLFDEVDVAYRKEVGDFYGMWGLANDASRGLVSSTLPIIHRKRDLDQES